jgi:negative regulator of sigma E activity
MFNFRSSFRRVVLAVGVCAALMALPASAVAQDALSNPSAAQYEPQSQVQGTSQNGSANENSTAGPSASRAATGGASSTLPFTGMDLALVAGVAILMIGTGLTLRRLSAHR